MEIIHDIRLRIEIFNKKPIELIDLTKSFVSLANQFNSFVAQNGESKEDREAKLYVREIKTGSVILDLVELATASLIPFAENVNTVIGFAEYLKKAYDYFKGVTDEPPSQFTQSDCKELAQIINPVANDNGSQMNVSTVIDNSVNIYLEVKSLDANALQNILDKAGKELKESEPSKEPTTKVLLTLHQTKADPKAKTGNKGVIEDISKKAFPLIFETEGLNKEIIHHEFNPYDKIFVVDAHPQHVGGKIAAYKILKLHEILDRN